MFSEWSLMNVYLTLKYSSKGAAIYYQIWLGGSLEKEVLKVFLFEQVMLKYIVFV